MEQCAEMVRDVDIGKTTSKTVTNEKNNWVHKVEANAVESLTVNISICEGRRVH